MRIGLVTDSLGHLDLPTMLDIAAADGIETLEFGCGNWSSAPHLPLAHLLESVSARETFLAALRDHRLTISALNCSGNPLHPGTHGEQHRAVTSQTIRLAGLLGVDRVVMMSGCPGGPGDANANWITTSWPPEAAKVLAWQWDEVVIPYWLWLVAEAEAAGVSRLCLELHGQQNVYNVATLKRLREAVGPVVGANFDPSHLFWMGADPLAAITALGEAIYHVHAKDTRIDPHRAAVNGLIETSPADQVASRAWSYVTLGDGHAAAWWQRFVQALRRAGYDDVLSIEHEDFDLRPEEGVTRSVELLRQVLGRAGTPEVPA
jgi:sugar phosphate isomerase/epimerase